MSVVLGMSTTYAYTREVTSLNELKQLTDEIYLPLASSYVFRVYVTLLKPSKEELNWSS